MINSDRLPLPSCPRVAGVEDAGACAAIYAPYVRRTAISFELEPPTPADMAARIDLALRHHAWLVVEDAGEVRGYAYGGPFKARAAYRFACEVSVYLAPDVLGRGVGRSLYDALLPRLAGLGYRRAVAGITLPNAPSERVHRGLGFEPVGVFRGVGWKFERWHDVLFLQRDLSEAPDAPPDAR